MKKNTSESGRSMVEMLGVIAIIGVISVGGITSMSYVDSYFRTNATLLEIDQVASNVMDLCSWSSSYEACGITNALLCSENIIECTDGNSPKRNRWGGSINISVVNSDTVEFIYSEVPSSVCNQMKEELNSNAGKHLIAITNACGDGGTVDVRFVLTE